MVARTNLFVQPATPHEYRPAGGEPRPTKTRPAAGEGPRKPPDGGQTVLADSMARAIAREAGAVGRYDVARRLYRDREAELLTRVARGSARAFSELDQLRRGPLYFPPTRFEGAVDFGPGAPSHAMRPNGDFRLGISNSGDDLSQHPAVRGAIPRVRQHRPETDVHMHNRPPTAELAIAAPSTPNELSNQTPASLRSRSQEHEQSRSPFIGSGVAATTAAARERRLTAGKPSGVWNGGGKLPEGKRHLSERKHLPGCTSSSTVAGQRQQRDELTVETARPLPAGWAKLRCRSKPSKVYYHDARTGQSQWERPSFSRSDRDSDINHNRNPRLEQPRSSSATVSSDTTRKSPRLSTASARSTRENDSGSNHTASARSRSSDSSRYVAVKHPATRQIPRLVSAPVEIHNSTGDHTNSQTKIKHRRRAGGSLDPAVVAMREQPAAGGGSWSGLQFSEQRAERHKPRDSNGKRRGRHSVRSHGGRNMGPKHSNGKRPGRQ